MAWREFIINDPFMPTNQLALSRKSIDLSATCWFAIAFIGQMIFTYYIVMLYFRSGIQGDFDKWNTASPHGFVEEDAIGNIGFGIHVMIAAIVSFLGPLQLIPQVRKAFPTFHRISGRIYIGAAFVISLAGVFLLILRGPIGGMIPVVFNVGNALIIMTSAFFAIKFARERKIMIHRQWAIRLFIGMSGVWFFRVFLMMWLGIHQAPVGFDPETFTGPFLNVLAFMVYIFPQVVVQFYFEAQKSRKPAIKWGFVSTLGLISLAMGFGIFAATTGMWLPRV